MSKRRANGGGSIRYCEKKKLWEARYCVTVNGVRKRKSLYRKTEKEARKAMIEALSQAQKGAYIEPSRLTVGEWLDTWVKEYNPNLKHSTEVSYTQWIKSRINPALGKIKLAALKTGHIQAFYNAMYAEGVSEKTVKNIHGVIHPALKQAVLNGMIAVNPSDACKLKKVQRADVNALDRAQLKALCGVLGTDVYSDVIRAALLTGMRESELLGLCWDCVDFDKHTITVGKQLNKPRTVGDKYGYGTPKNGKARTVAVPDMLLTILKQRRRQQTEERLAAGSFWDEGAFTGLVFETATGKHLQVVTLFRHYKKALEAAGLPNFRFHDLRHTYAVHSLQAGNDVKTVSESLGHSGIDITMRTYLHSLEEMKQQGAQRVETYFSDVVGVKIGVN